ncbi:leucine Rich repeat-containing domain protein [Fructobacillus pseudoficulneus]|uniref:Leucine Rich repeat-containing domain protein n=1 Tax=Fructobacillus pseudoficulneus TaxID=220714 RepID=A0A3F3GVJ0_9LACO|nr:hypothetical protein [Fructobacillus pseudoficulneus]GAP03315.1 leucine Rich repeat-containing domain protein [Fructobacillus pseudoficulneus]SEH44094.1 hypothetical protein SAMN05660469_1122 [Fructobacillus pseudoficulneus]
MQTRVQKFSTKVQPRWRGNLFSAGLVMTTVVLMANSVQAHAVANTSNTTNTANPTNQTSQNAVGDASDAATWMPDETLRKAFATQLNIDESQLTTTNIATVKSVKITSGTISSIQGLHYATGLESITVIGNQNQANRSAEENNISQYQDSNSQYPICLFR